MLCHSEVCCCLYLLSCRVVLSVSDMTELGLKITGATGEAKLKVTNNQSIHGFIAHWLLIYNSL